MTDPERLLGAQGDADPLERELLASVKRVDAPAGAKDKAWLGIAAQVGAGAVAVSAAAQSASSASAAAPVAAVAAKAGAGSLLPAGLGVKAALLAHAHALPQPALWHLGPMMQQGAVAKS